MSAERRGQSEYYHLDPVSSINLQYDVYKSLNAQLRTVIVIVLSFGLQDVAREFYMEGRSTTVSQLNFLITSSIALIAIVMSTILDTFIASWQIRDVHRWKSLRRKLRGDSFDDPHNHQPH